MLESEAKTKWCPFSRVVSNGIVANRDNPNDSHITNVDASALCIGSACMAWRRIPHSQLDQIEVTVGPGDKFEAVYKDEDGCCGLAGQR